MDVICFSTSLILLFLFLTMAAVRLACVACSATCEIDMTRCGCGTCVPQEAAFYAGAWMDWKGKMYCSRCIVKSGWQKRAEDKALQHFENQIDDMCPPVIESVTFKARKTLGGQQQLVPQNAPSTSTNMTPSSSNGQDYKDEVQVLRRTVEVLMARVTTLEDMKRAKRNLDARLDDFEDRLTLMNTNVNANRERIEVLEMEKDEEFVVADGK